MRCAGKRFLWLLLLFCMFFLIFTSCSAQAEELISIDTDKRYQGMNASFARGYVPKIKKNTMYLTIPFQTKANIKEDILLVGISFEKEENCPFYFKNYQKEVHKSKNGIYVYRCKIKLKKHRVNGQYPLRLMVLAQTKEEVIRQEVTVYIEITDGQTAAEEESYDKEMAMQETGEADYGHEETAASKEEIIHQPRLIIAQNSLQGTEIPAGETVVWSLSAQNCSKDQEVENMKITLMSEHKDVSFEKNSWYFARAEPGKTVDLSQSVTVSAIAPAESVPIQFQFDYEDKKGNTYNTTETLHFTISQKQQAEIVNFVMPESIYEADTQAVTFQVFNTGLSVLYNARVRIEAAGLFANETFLGTVEAGTSCDGEMQIFAGTLNMNAQGEILKEDGEMYGDLDGEVIFSYENEQGEITEQRQKFSTVIKKPQVVELKVEKQKQETNQWWITIIILVILVLIFVIIWLYLRMKYYQRMRQEIYEKI